MRFLSSATLALIVLAAPALSHAGTVYYLGTPQSGADTTIDSAHSTAWYSPNLVSPAIPGTVVSIAVAAFDNTFDWSLGGGNFTLKEGPGTVADITFSLWDYGTMAVPTVGTEVASVTWNAANVTQQYTSTPMYFTDNGLINGNATPYDLQLGHQYIAELTSDASTAGNVQFFIKDPQNITIQDTNGASLPTDAGAPEPGTWALAFTGIAALVSARKTRARS